MVVLRSIPLIIIDLLYRFLSVYIKLVKKLASMLLKMKELEIVFC